MYAVRGAAVLMVLGSFACADVPCLGGMVRVADSCVVPVTASDSGAPDAGEASTPAPDAETPDATPTAESCSDLMIGTYAVRDTSFARANGVGGDQIFTTVDYKRVVIAPAPDNGLQMTAELCYAETIDNAGSPTQVPSQNLGYLAKDTTSPLLLDCEAGTWRLPEMRLTIGFEPGVPAGCEGGAPTSTNDEGASCDCPNQTRADDVPLPNDADDCRITNEDEDMHPGVTVIATWLGFQGDFYMALDREGYSAGSIASDGYHRGGWVDTGSENVILGCSDIFFNGCPDPDPAPCTAAGVNEMIFVPVDDGIGCSAIRTDRTNWFKDYPQRRLETNQCF